MSSVVAAGTAGAAARDFANRAGTNPIPTSRPPSLARNDLREYPGVTFDDVCVRFKIPRKGMKPFQECKTKFPPKPGRGRLLAKSRAKFLSLIREKSEEPNQKAGRTDAKPS